MQFIAKNQAGLDDVSLMRLLACNDGDALSDLYDRYGKLVYSVAINFVSDQAVAEEIAQDVFTRVWQKASTYDAGIARVSTWLIMVWQYPMAWVMSLRDFLALTDLMAYAVFLGWVEIWMLYTFALGFVLVAGPP